MPLVEVRGLSKRYRVAERSPGLWGAMRSLASRRYRTVHALDEVSFELEQGELVGYIGPNGAGKSTTIKIMSGILCPDEGSCLIRGRVPWKERVAHVREIGVVFGQRTQLWWDLPVIESFDLLRDIYAVPAAAYREERERLVAHLELDDYLDTPVRQLSLGQRMRCDLAAALLHRPAMLFLDEPTIGLDAVAKLAVRSFIRELRKRGDVTVVLTTHDLDDIEALCDRIIMISEGRIVSDGTPGQLREQFGTGRRLTVDLRDAGDSFTVPDGVEVVVGEGIRRVLAFAPERVSAAVLIAQLVAQVDVQDIVLETEPIEEIVARFYSQQEGMT